jgi:hypothetical protein
MWQVAVFCPHCSEESEVVVADLDQVDREVCPCGHGFVVVSVANFEPEYAEDGELVRLPSRSDLSQAA